MIEVTDGNHIRRQCFLPTLWQLICDSPQKVSRLFGKLLLVLCEQLLPLFLCGSAAGSGFGVVLIHLAGHVEFLLGIHTELNLDVHDVVGLQRRTVHSVGTLELGAEADGGGELNDGGLVFNGFGFGDGRLDGRKIIIAVLDVDAVPAVGVEAFQDVFGESAVGAAVLVIC